MMVWPFNLSAVKVVAKEVAKEAVSQAVGADVVTVVGPKGERGDPGLNGATGAVGETGDTGHAGSVGDTGPRGEQGETGIQGLQGIQGETGQAGNVGAQGEQGERGEQGIQGNPGPVGPQGVKGQTGDTGAQGVAGPSAPPRVQSQVTRALNTIFQPNATRDVLALYSVLINVTATVAAAQNGEVVLEIASNAAFTQNVQALGIAGNGQSFTLVLALQGVQPIVTQICGVIPAGYYARLRTVNVTGAPTFTYRVGQETQL